MVRFLLSRRRRALLISHMWYILTPLAKGNGPSPWRQPVSEFTGRSAIEACNTSYTAVRRGVRTSFNAARAEFGLSPRQLQGEWTRFYRGLPSQCAVAGTLGKCIVYIPVFRDATNSIQAALSQGMIDIEAKVVDGNYVTLYQSSCGRSGLKHLPDLSDLCYESVYAFTFTHEPLARFISGYTEFVRHTYRWNRDDSSLRRALSRDSNEPQSILNRLVIEGRYDLPHAASHFSLMIAAFANALGKLNFVGNVANFDRDWGQVLNSSRFVLPELASSFNVRDDAPFLKPNPTFNYLRNEMISLLDTNHSLRRSLCYFLEPDYRCFGYNFDACLDGSALGTISRTL